MQSLSDPYFLRMKKNPAPTGDDQRRMNPAVNDSRM